MDKNENLTFYSDFGPLGWGTSAHKEFAHSQTKLVVKGYDISELIDQYSKDDYIVVKVDIEGTEFPLFEHFLREGTINKIRKQSFDIASNVPLALLCKFLV
jgi:hypothetical protein